MLPHPHILFAQGLIDADTLRNLRSCCREFRNELAPVYILETERICQRKARSDGSDMRALERLSRFIERYHLRADSKDCSTAYDLFCKGFDSFAIAKAICAEHHETAYSNFHPPTFLAYMNTAEDTVTQEFLMRKAWESKQLFPVLCLGSAEDVALFITDLFTISKSKGASWLWFLAGFDMLLKNPVGQDFFKKYSHFVGPCLERLDFALKDPFLADFLEPHSKIVAKLCYLPIS